MDFLTVSQMADMAGCSEQYIRMQLKNGKIKGADRHGKSWAVTPKDFEQYLNSNGKNK